MCAERAQAKECRKLQYAKSSGSNAIDSSTTERRKANGKMFILSHRKSAIRLNKLLQCRSAIVAISKVERTTQTINVSSDRSSCLVFFPARRRRMIVLRFLTCNREKYIFDYTSLSWHGNRDSPKKERHPSTWSFRHATCPAP